jgi:hypothetical protein
MGREWVKDIYDQRIEHGKRVRPEKRDDMWPMPRQKGQAIRLPEEDIRYGCRDIQTWRRNGLTRLTHPQSKQTLLELLIRYTWQNVITCK